jgi:hypothetical protein
MAEGLEDEKNGRIDTPRVDTINEDVETTVDSNDIEAPVDVDDDVDINTSVTPPSAATIDLATNRPELTVATVSKEAQRLKEKEKLPEGEVFISLH